MTRDEILAMDAGGELDDLVAEHVMGWRRFLAMDGSVVLFPVETAQWIEEHCAPDSFKQVDAPLTYPGKSWAYSTQLDRAWKVVEKLHEPDEKGQPRDVLTLVYGRYLCDRDEWAWRAEWRHAHVSVCAPTAPEAICKAALLAAMQGEG